MRQPRRAAVSEWKFRNKTDEFSMGVHGGAKLDAGDDLRLGSLCFKSHKPDIRG